jgi:hypothetical protein
MLFQLFVASYCMILNHLSFVDEVQGDKVTNEVQTAKTLVERARAFFIRVRYV